MDCRGSLGKEDVWSACEFNDAMKRKVPPHDVALVHSVLLFLTLMGSAIVAWLMTMTDHN